MEHLTYGWEVVKEDLKGWIIFNLVLGIVIGFTFGLGAFLIPNAFRAILKSLPNRKAPEVGALFNFDNIANDAITLIVQSAVNFVGFLACGLGTLVTGPLTSWMVLLCAENRYAPVDCFKASMAHAKSRIVEILIFHIVLSLVVTIGSIVTCGLGSLVLSPVAYVAICRFYELERDNIISAASAEQIPML